LSQSTEQGVIEAVDWDPSEAELQWYADNDLLTTTGPDEDPVFHFRCVRSGACCRATLCSRGVRDEATGHCRYLSEAATLPGGELLYNCTLPGGTDDPARQIGKGCCFPWSPERRALIEAYRERTETLIHTVTID